MDMQKKIACATTKMFLNSEKIQERKDALELEVGNVMTGNIMIPQQCFLS